MEPSFEERINAVDWPAYATAYGSANDVPSLLLALASSDHKAAMVASHKLWCGLCHQHAYLSSAALPAYPFILEVLRSANEQLTVEILDIFTGFAFRSTLGPDGPSPNEWGRELREKLRDQLPLFRSLSKHSNDDIAQFAGSIVANLSEFPQ
jgi:hypothetical protein